MVMSQNNREAVTVHTKVHDVRNDKHSADIRKERYSKGEFVQLPELLIQGNKKLLRKKKSLCAKWIE